MRRAQPVTLNTAQCKQLDRYARGRQVAVRLALRARIVLLAAHGLENKQIATQLGVSRQLVARWRTRFLESGIAGIAKDAPRPGRTPAVSKQKVQQCSRNSRIRCAPAMSGYGARASSKTSRSTSCRRRVSRHSVSSKHWACLKGANLRRAHLRGAVLTEAHLQFAILRDARLQ